MGSGGAMRDGAARSGWMALALGAAVMSAAAVGLLAAPALDRALVHAASGGDRRGRDAAPNRGFFPALRRIAGGGNGSAAGGGQYSHADAVPLCRLLARSDLPLGVWLCFAKGWGAAGLWTGLSLGLILIGIALTLVWRRTAAGFAMLK